MRGISYESMGTITYPNRILLEIQNINKSPDQVILGFAEANVYGWPFVVHNHQNTGRAASQKTV